MPGTDWATGMTNVRGPALPTPGGRETGKQDGRYNDGGAPSPRPGEDRGGLLRKHSGGGDPEPRRGSQL